MAQAGFFGRGKSIVPRSLLEVTIASLATFLVTAVWYDLPHRGVEVPPAPQPEKVSLQASPLTLRLYEPTADDEATRFMEAVALSHLAPLRPQGEIDRAAVEPVPPPAVQQVLAHTLPLQKPKPVAAAVPLPPRQPSSRAATPSPASPAAASSAVTSAPAGLRPPVDIPAASGPAPDRGLRIPVVSDLARSTQKTVSDGFDNLSRGVGSLLRK